MRTSNIRRRIVTIGVAFALTVVPMAAYAANVFDDVDDTSSHIDGITFMKDSGVSVGCDATNYCPADSVTRAQMGTFMYRLSGNDPATPPSVIAASAQNADTVDGRDANEMVRVAFDQVTDNALVGANGTAASATIEAPGAGFLIISGSSDVYGTASDTLTCVVEVNDAAIAASTRTMELNDPDGNEEDCSTDAVYTMVFGGTYTVDLEFLAVGATTTIDETVLTVLYVPFDFEGNTPKLVLLPLAVADAEQGNGN